jgi:hypothetical protein
MDLNAEQRDWLIELSRQIVLAGNAASQRIAVIDALAKQSGELAQMDYGFLFDKTRHLLDHRLQRQRAPRRYQLLRPAGFRSPAGSFVAIAQGQLPQESWFALGRLLTGTGGEPACCRGAARCSST